MKKTMLGSLLAVCAPLMTMAHPGHGDTDGYTITHYFREPVHLAALAIGVVAAVVYVRFFMKKKEHSKN